MSAALDPRAEWLARRKARSAVAVAPLAEDLRAELAALEERREVVREDLRETREDLHALRRALPLRGLPLAIVDTETTGVDPSTSEIVEIAVSHCVLAGQPEVVFQTYVKPSSPMPEGATKVNGITDEMLVGAPTWAEVLPRVADVLAGRVVCAYNAPFDYRVILEECGRVGADCPAPWPWLDVMIPAKTVDKYDKGKRLSDVAQRRGLVLDAHGAAGDTIAAGMILPMLLREGMSASRREIKIPKVANLGAYLDWQRLAALQLEKEFGEFSKSEVDYPWHALEGVPRPVVKRETPSARRCRVCQRPLLDGVGRDGSAVGLDAETILVVPSEIGGGIPDVSGRDRLPVLYYRGRKPTGESAHGYVIPDGLHPELPRVAIHPEHDMICMAWPVQAKESS